MVQCYDWNVTSSKVDVLADIWHPCPAGDTCCMGSDVCLDYNLCSSKSTYKRDNAFSGYYIARCTDPTYTDPACQKVCNAPGPPDAVYNSSSQQWSCCGNNAAGEVSCDNPTAEYFQAPAPSALIVIQSGAVLVSSATLAPGSKTISSSSTVAVSSSTSSQSSASTLSSISTSTSALTPSSTPTSSTDQEPTSNGLSSGAKAGIAIGVVLGVVAIIGVVVFLLLRRKRQDKADRIDMDVPGYTKYAEEKPAVAPFMEKAPEARTLRTELPSDETFSRQAAPKYPVHEIGSSR